MKRKCQVCGLPLRSSQILCARCVSVISRKLGTCTGVKYPCSYHCKSCYYDSMYKSS